MTALLFGSILENGSVTGAAFFAATACSLVLGLYIAMIHRVIGGCTRSFLITLALLPAIVQLVILLVNGNIGAGVAVAGAFSLVRFRSAPGSGKEITAIFLAMAVGLATGMGYLGIAFFFAVVVTIAALIFEKTGLFGGDGQQRELKVLVPENLDYEGIFDDIFARYTKRAELAEVKTANMGSVYKLTWKIHFRDGAPVKAFMDELRQRNGNLEISCGRAVERGDLL
ncbi:MAG: DUF4956 domain-containing protein [Lachnospiraceae bacterium]|nr:DUF4956 domain-containing protein [Lachnospiraceae bacterium]